MLPQRSSGRWWILAAMVVTAFHSFENNANFWALTGFVRLTVELIALKEIALNTSQLVRRLRRYIRFFRRCTSWGGTCAETTSRGRLSSRASAKLPRTALVKRRTSLKRVLFTCSAQPSRVNRSTSLRAPFARVNMASHNLALQFAPDENANLLLVSCFRLCEYEWMASDTANVLGNATGGVRLLTAQQAK